MAERERKNELKIYLSDDEQYILEQKVKLSGMRSKSAFLRHQILYGYVKRQCVRIGVRHMTIPSFGNTTPHSEKSAAI